MKKILIFISSIVLISLNSTYGSDRYWVNGSGSWNSPSHWSLTSGGTAGALEPTSADNVYFDYNSFNNVASTVTLDVPVSCNNFNWIAYGSKNTLAGNSFIKLNCYGSFIFNENIINQFYGEINFLSNSPNNMIVMNNTLHSNVNLEGNGKWLLDGDLVSTGTLLPLSAVSKIIFNVKNSFIFFSNYANPPIQNIPVKSMLKAAALSVTFTSTETTCSDSCNGKIVAAVTGGVPPYTYQWYNPLGDLIVGEITDSITHQCQGFYQLDVVDSDLPQNEYDGGQQILAPAAIVILLSHGYPIEVNCFGNHNGQIKINGVGGTTPLDYSDNLGVSYQAGNLFSLLAPGNYNIEVKDANSCTATYSANPITITQPASAVSGSITAQTNVLCFGAAKGSVTVAGAGGTPTYLYNIDGGAFGASGTFNTLLAGTHTVVVQDANGCQSTNILVNITQPASAVTISSVVSVNVDCNGANDGSITITASGGTGVITYSDNSGGSYQASNQFLGLAPGIYNVEVKDANGCTATYAPITITQPATAVSGSITSQTNVLCFGLATGSVTVAGAGGSPPYTYNINGGGYQISGTFNGLSAGSNPVIVKDANGCKITVAVTITQPASAVTISSVVSSNVPCNGANDGSITVTASGGTGIITYSDNSGGSYQASNIFSPLSPGIYNIEVKDANGCTVTYATNPITITQPATAVSGSITSQTNVLCKGAATGSVTVAGAGGTPILPGGTYLYNIDGGVFGASGTFNLLLAGNHTVVVQDANGCKSNVAVTITQPASVLIISSVVSTNASCSGVNDGSITITASGGTGVITYSDNSGVSYQGSDLFNGLAGGNYNVAVKDANTCVTNYATNPVVIVAPSSITITSVTQTNEICNGGSTGTITVTASGGTGALTYSDNNGTSYQAGNAFNTLTANNYFIWVQDANGCKTQYGANPVAITQPIVISITNVAQVNVTGCAGNNNGSITVTASGGTGALTYSDNSGVSFQAGDAFNPLNAGNYDIEVKDAKGCIVSYATNPVVITQPAAITITSVVSTNVSCHGGNNGQIVVTASGGTGALTYSDDNGITYQASATFSPLTAGFYRIRVKDANNCVVTYATNPVTITQPTAVVITSVTSTNVSTCANGNNGTISITASGGTGALNYSVDNGVTYQAGNNFNTLTAGSYTIKVKDANACTVTYGANPIVITAPPAITISSVVKTDVNTCFGGSNGTITITASGGTGVLNYSDNNGVSYQAGNVFNTLSAGNYDIQVKDANGCTTPWGGNPVVVGQPTKVIVTSVVVTDVTGCAGNNNGTITVTASGGTGALQYSDNNGTSFQAGNVFNALIAGNYTIEVEDANLCTSFWGVPVVLTAPAPLVATVTSTNVTGCFGGTNGTITISSPSGGSGTYQYTINGTIWSATTNYINLPAASYDVKIRDAANPTCFKILDSPLVMTQPAAVSITSVVQNNVTGCSSNDNGSIVVTASGGTGALQYSDNSGVSWQAGSTFSNLGSGNYIIEVKDANACSTNWGVPIVLTAPAPLAATVNSTNVSGCHGGTNGTITISSPSGGSGTYQYTINGMIWSATTNYINLPAASYDVKIRDAANPTCATLLDSPLIITQPVALTFTYTQVNILCFNAANGSITVIAAGGTPPYSYSKNGGASYPLSDPDSVFTGLSNSIFPIKVKDANNCLTAIQNVTIHQPPQLLIPTEITEDSLNLCYGDSTGIIIITASGGVAPIHYSIDSGLNYYLTDTFKKLGGGNYQTIVKDANGCSRLGSLINIYDPPPIIIDFLNITNITTCAGAPDGSILVLATGGSTELRYTDDLINYNLTGEFDNLVNGNYTITMLDSNNCTKDTAVTITAPPPIVINTRDSTNPSCAGKSDGTITVTATGGTGLLTYTLMDTTTVVSSNFTGSFINLKGGNYTVNITDVNNCLKTTNFSLATPNALSLVSQVVTNISCNGLTDGIITIVTSGGTAPISYSLNGIAGPFVNNGGIFNGLPAGNTNYVAVQDINNCSLAGDTLTIINPPVISITSVSQTNLSCGGNPTGTITVVASGGTPGLSYTLTPLSIINYNGLFTNLPAGIYNISVSDTNHCGPVDKNAINLSQPIPIVYQSINVTKPTCNLSNDGSISVTGSGGTGPLSYSIDGSPYQASGTFNGLTGGNYVLSIQDTTGCSKDSSVSIPASQFSVSSSSGSNFCAGNDSGNIIVLVTGGTGPFSFTLNPGNIIYNSWNDSGIFHLLTPNTDTVIVTDAHNCTDTTIIQPPVFMVNTAITTSSPCDGNNGTITITASSGTLPYIYSINSGTTWFPSNLFSNLAPGSYPIEAKENGGCVTNYGSVIIQGSSIVFDSVVTVPVSPCSSDSNGSITVYATGGSGALQYSKDGGNTYQAGNIFSPLGEGLFNITVKDSTACKHDTTVNIIGPAPIVINVTTVNIDSTPVNGVISLTKVSGGSGFTNYSIDNGTTDTVQKNNGLFSNLDTGTYSIVVKDSLGCVAVNDTTVILLNVKILLKVQITVNNEPCFGDTIGKISMTVTDSTAVLPEWFSIGGAPFKNDSVFSNLKAGIYHISVYDTIAGKPKAFHAIRKITQPLPFTLYDSVTNGTCSGIANGEIVIDSITGGNGGDKFTWAGGSTDSTLDSVSVGYHYITLSDSTGCSTLDSIMVNSTEPPITITKTLIDSAYCSGKRTDDLYDGAISILAITDSTRIKTITWSNGKTGFTIDSVPAGAYTAIITDTIGCVYDTMMNVPYKHLVKAIISTNDTNVCWNTQVPLTGKGGQKLTWSPTDSISWTSSNGDSMLTKSILSPLNTYILRASDSVCYDIDTALVITFSRQLFSLAALPDTVIISGDPVTINVTPDSLVKRFAQYVISPCINDVSSTCVSTLPSFTLTPKQTLLYTIYATTIAKYGGCTDQTAIKITISNGAKPQTAFTPNGDGQNDKWVIVNGTLFPDLLCEVFNRWGELIFQKKGCTEILNGTDCAVWDGYRNGTRVPTGTYYYVVHLGDGYPVLTGTLTIIY